MINFLLIVNKLGQVCVAQYYTAVSSRDKELMQCDVIKRCLQRSEHQCSFFEFRDFKLIYERHGPLCYIVGVDETENELATLELISLIVETFKRCFERVNEQTLYSHLENVYFILDEMIVDGRVVESNHRKLLAPIRLLQTSGNS